MTAIRVAKRKRFTVLDRSCINDTSLSFRARGILVWLLDKPDDWITTADRIESQGPEGREAIAASLKEMERCGYLVRNRRRDERGVWRVDWTVYEEPPTANRSRVAVAGEPLPDSRTLSTEDSKLNTETPAKQIFQADEEARLAAVEPPWVAAGVSRREWLERAALSPNPQTETQ